MRSYLYNYTTLTYIEALSLIIYIFLSGFRAITFSANLYNSEIMFSL